MDIRTTATKLLVYTVLGVTVGSIIIFISPAPVSEDTKVHSNQININNVSYPQVGLDKISNSTEILKPNSLLRVHKVGIQTAHTGLIEYSTGRNKHTIQWEGNSMIYESPENQYYADGDGIYNKSTLETSGDVDSHKLINTYYNIIVQGISFVPQSQIQQTIKEDIQSQNFVAESATQYSNRTTIIQYVSSIDSKLTITNHGRIIYYKSPSSMIEYKNRVQTSNPVLPPNWYVNQTN